MFKFGAKSHIEERTMVARNEWTSFLGDYGYIRGDKEPPISCRIDHPMIKFVEKSIKRKKLTYYKLRKEFPKIDNYVKSLYLPIYSTRIDHIDTGYTDDYEEIMRLCDLLKIPYEVAVDYALNNYAYRKEIIKYTRWYKEMRLQYDIGKLWEDTVIDYYNKRNYFTHKIPTLNSGTVFDIIAIHNGAALCIECKHVRGDKLYYKGSGLAKKTDEIEHFINTTGNNLYIYVYSDKTGAWWTTWKRSSELLKEQGYLTKEDCFPCNVELLESDLVK